MLRDVAILGAAFFSIHLSSAAAQPAPAPGTQTWPAAHAKMDRKPAAVKHRAVQARVKQRPAATPAQPALASETPPTLTFQEERAGDFAVQNGDSEFLMVDKALGRIILFQNGEPVYSGPALTGQSTADRLPPGMLAEKFAKLSDIDDKVTPAGRFTVSRGNDKLYGTLLDVNEIRGKDWGIAIHQVYLGDPTERRAERLRSPDDNDKHITYGCINVEPQTIRVLLRELPKDHPTALYILPEDEATTSAYFAPHNS
jgi:hypothetical protein